MRIWTLSDLHLAPKDFHTDPEIWSFVPDADVCVVAGDIADGSPERSMEWLAQHIGRHMPVVTVLGNHDFYGENLSEARQAARQAADRLGIHLLDDSTVTIAGTRFVGATLWTDYDLYSDGDEDLREGYMHACRNGLSDHSQIGLAHGNMEMFKPRHALQLHKKSRFFIEDALREGYSGPTVVVTHHAPQIDSVHPAFAGDPVTPGFVSDLSDVFGRFEIDAWLHGHTHCAFDYEVNGARVVCNPRGYSHEQDFDPQLVIDISRFGPRLVDW